MDERAQATVASGATTASLTFTVPANNPVFTNLTTFARFRISSVAADVANPTGSALDGEVEDYQITNVSTPINLGYFLALAGVNKGDVEFQFTTANEVGNVGFNLYARDRKGNWSKINDTLIPSKVIDATSATEYQYTASGVKGRIFALGDVDLFGKETIHGPFRLGKAYGQRANDKVIDWNKVKSEHKAKKGKRKRSKEQRMQRKMRLKKAQQNAS